ncbi:unnamed protein product [Blepharisma stoltei]|uniref:DNA damage-binding protein 1 n=1 Tax=Blepharisma stoltei TaxID=1481888 RepID=A0AAU9JRG3_9CILI|nr:unnamed protein product [Blepharisma stoltei]
MSKWNYLASAHKSSAVATSLVCNFTSPEDRNLIVAKGNRIEIHTLTEENIIPIQEFSLFGIVRFIEKLHPQTGSDSLLIVTDPYNLSLAVFENSKLCLKESVSLKEKLSLRLEYFPFATLDPHQRAFCMHIYKGLIRIIGIKSNFTIGVSFNSRIEESWVIDMKFLNNSQELQLGILFKKESEFIFKAFPVSLAEKNISDYIWSIAIREPVCKFLNLQHGSIGIVDMNSIKIYREQENDPSMSANAEFGKVNVVHNIDISRWVIGNQDGNLFIVFLNHELKVECLGRCSMASSISYLDNNYLFIGSSFGDSQLIRVLTERQENSFLSVEQKYQNIGPILDFKVIEGERKGLCNIISCSGYNLDGSLRLVNKGISVTVENQMEIGNVIGLFTLQVEDSDFTHIVLSFIDATRILKIQDEALKPISYPDIDSKISSIYVGITKFGIVQVTKFFIQLLNFKWQSVFIIRSEEIKENSEITLAESSGEKICIVLNGLELIVFSANENRLEKLNNQTFQNEIACIGMSHDMIAVGLWIELNIIVIDPHSMQETWRDHLGGEVLPRSLMFVELEDIKYLFAGLADGHLLTYTLPNFTKRSQLIGTQQVILKAFKYQNKVSVFAGCDQPKIVYSHHHRLITSTVNSDSVSFVSPFGTKNFPDCLALISGQSLIMISIEDLQNFTIKTFPQGLSMRRIGMVDDYFVCLARNSANIDSLMLFSNTLVAENTHSFEHSEAVNALLVDKNRIIVGTGVTDDRNNDPKSGHLRVFVIRDRAFHEVSRFNVRDGGVSCIVSIGKNRLVGGVHSVIHYWGIDDENQITLIDASHKLTYVYSMDTCQNLVAVADLIKSVTIFSANDEGLTVVAKNYSAMWPTCIQFICQSLIVVADTFGNLLLLEVQNNMKLNPIGGIHIGETINCIRKGPLIQGRSDEFPDNVESLLFATAKGNLGVIASLPLDIYTILNLVQEELTSKISQIGNMSLKNYRSPDLEKQKINFDFFLDGDFIEAFLDISPEEQLSISTEVGLKLGKDLNVQDLQKLILSLSKVH